MTRAKRESPNFGFDPSESPHHFAVVAEGDRTVIEERFTFGENGAEKNAEVRAVVDPYRWKAIVNAAQADFNRRLHDARRKTGRFGEGEHLLAPHFGREITLLAWATEEIDPTDLPNAIANWQGLAPEERWWLYLMVRASSQGPDPVRNPRGWRRAIRVAFSESPPPPPANARSAAEPVVDTEVSEPIEPESAAEGQGAGGAAGDEKECERGAVANRATPIRTREDKAIRRRQIEKARSLFDEEGLS